METNGRDHAVHVLFLPFIVQGHINPMLQFAKRLSSKGLKATLVTTNFIAKSSKVEYGSVRIESISDGYDDCGSAGAGSHEEYIERFKEVGPRTLADLIKKLVSSGSPVSCLVYDPFLPWALDVASQLGLTGAAFFTQSCTVSTIYYHVYNRRLMIPVEEPTVSLPGLPPLGLRDLPSVLWDKAFGSFYSALVSNQFSNIEKADWVLFNTFDKLEDEVVSWLARIYRLKTIGPMVPSMYLDKLVQEDDDYGLNLCKPNSGACMKWLDERENGSVVYASFGSMAVVGVEQIAEMAWALKGSNYHFLWVVRAAEEHKLSKKFFEETAEKGLIVTWCPQLEVLAHKALGCFVTHCGWNSILEALSLGVPMVAMPLWTDQPTNARSVEDVWRVGVRVKADEKGLVSREEIKLCIREVMEGERADEMTRNACKWKELISETLVEGGSSDKNIEEFVGSIINK